MKALSKYAQTWSEQARQGRVCRPSAPLRLGDGWKYFDAASHANTGLFRRRMQQRQREASNA
jgi:hypothetical protein